MMKIALPSNGFSGVENKADIPAWTNSIAESKHSIKEVFKNRLLTLYFHIDISLLIISLRDHIKSSGKFTIFTRLKTEGGGGQSHITEKLPLKIQTVEDILSK